MSYGINAPQGLVPCRTLTGAPITMPVNTYTLSADSTGQITYDNNIFTNDPVTFDGNGNVRLAAVGEPILGVFISCQYEETTATNPVNPFNFYSYWRASSSIRPGSKILVSIMDDPNLIYNIQSNLATGLTMASVGKNANFAIPLNGAGLNIGDFSTGISKAVLDGVPSSGNAPYNLKVLRSVTVPGNGWSVNGNLPYNNVEVIANNHIYKGGSGTAGI